MEEAIFLPLLRELESSGSDGIWTVLDVIDIYLSSDRKPSAKLIDLVRRALLQPQLIADGPRSNMDSHRLESLVERLGALDCIDKDFASNLANQCLGICRRDINSKVYFFSIVPFERFWDSSCHCILIKFGRK
ncbi:MAG: hypothetical protein H6851_02395 [Geminicoccaceae bacterium]|nr:hypothetical protein [Geminicoccaceae bacterium]